VRLWLKAYHLEELINLYVQYSQKSHEGQHFLQLAPVREIRNRLAHVLRDQRLVQFLHRCPHGAGRFSYLPRLLQPHQSLKWILHQYLDLGGGALLEAFSQYVLALNLEAGADLFGFRQEKVKPLAEGDVAVGQILSGRLLLLYGKLPLVLVVANQLHSPLDGDQLATFRVVFLLAFGQQLFAGGGVELGAVE
jgi:hypothetical protein